MDPLNLLKELFGDEPIRRILVSGFDTVGKIAAATPESLSFFAGIQETLARQIVQSAEEFNAGAVQKPGIRAALAGTATSPTQPRELARTAAPKKEPAKAKPVRVELVDERPLFDGGALLRSLANERRPKEFLHDEDFLEEVGLSGAEAGFLEGMSPWPTDPPARERVSPAPIEMRPDPPPSLGNEIEFASVSDWSPEKDPDPVPRLVRAPELGGEDLPEETPTPIVAVAPLAPIRVLASKTVPVPSETAEKLPEAPDAGGSKRSLWKFGR